MKCAQCNGDTIKSGVMIVHGKEVQRYKCKNCGYLFWEGQTQREKTDDINPLCIQCGKKTHKYGYGMLSGDKKRKYRCNSCGHVFLKR